MADNYQTSTTVAKVALATNLVAPVAFVDSILRDLPAGNTTISSISPPGVRASVMTQSGASSDAPPGTDVTPLVAGSNLAYVNFGTTGAWINLNALTPAQQSELAGIIYGPTTAGGSATGTFTVNYSNTSSNPATAFHGSIMVGTGNNLLNINTAQAFSINAPDAQAVGTLTQQGIKGEWNNIFNLSGRGDATVSLGSGDNFVSTGSGTNHIDLLGTHLNAGGQANYDLIRGGAGSDIVTSGTNFRGYANVDGGAGDNQLVVTGALEGAVYARGTISFSLQNGGLIDVKNIQDFVFGDAAGGPKPTIDLGKFSKALSITAGAGDYRLTTGSGSDSVALGNGNDSVFTGNGNDSVFLGNGSDSINTGNGNDSIVVGVGNDSINSGNGNDFVRLGGGNDSVSTGNGNDSVFAASGNDSVYLGTGNDLLTFGTGFAGEVTVDGGTGKNTLDLTFVTIAQATQANKSAPVEITLSNGATIDAQHVQSFMYSDATTGQVVTVGVADLINIFGHGHG
jgi:Ca2+-binding RTX toxin-like protein